MVAYVKTIKGAATDMRYCARSKFYRKKNLARKVLGWYDK